MTARTATAGRERGFSLLELMTALIVLTVGVIAVARLFPAGERGQTQDRMQTTAGYFASEEIERLGGLSWSDAELGIGRHPAGSAVESIGSNSNYSRWYQVGAMDAPLSDLKKVTVYVTWATASGRTVSVSTYVRR